MQNQKSDWETSKTWFVSQISLKLAWKSGFLAFWAKIIKKIFLHHFPEAITLLTVVQFSIFLIDSKIGDQIYQNQLKNWKLNYFERRESQNKKGAPRIRGPSAEKLKSAIFQGISLKLGPVGIFISRNWYQTHFSCFGWFQLT